MESSPPPACAASRRSSVFPSLLVSLGLVGLLIACVIRLLHLEERVEALDRWRRSQTLVSTLSREAFEPEAMKEDEEEEDEEDEEDEDDEEDDEAEEAPKKEPDGPPEELPTLETNHEPS